MQTVLIIEPNNQLREALVLTIQASYRVISLFSIREALLAIQPETISAVVLGSVNNQSELVMLRHRLGVIPFILLPGLEGFAHSQLEKVVVPLSAFELRRGLNSVLGGEL